MADNNANPGHFATVVTFRECRRNYAKQIGGHVVDGCHEFLQADANAPPQAALYCAACGCHRNYHRREEVSININDGAAQFLHQIAVAPPPQPPVLIPHHQPVPAGPAQEAVEEDLGDGEVDEAPPEPRGRGRGRGRLSPEQKEAMREYAEGMGWTLVGHSEEELVGFCCGIGVTIEVFKAWMRNNRRRYVRGAGGQGTSAAGARGGV